MEHLKDRTRAYALTIVRFCRTLPPGDDYRVVGRQLMRAGTSTAANYRAACRARSQREFVSKLGIVEEEADETLFWLELLRDLFADDDLSPVEIDRLHAEGAELLAIVVASIKTARRRP